MLFRMLIISMVMIVGFGLALSGGMILFIGKPAEIPMAIGFLLPGLGFGLGGLYLLIKMNKQYQLDALEKALAEPDKILLDIAAIGNQKRILLTEEALFLGEKHYPFKASYEHLKGIELEEDILKVNSAVYGGDRHLNRNLKIEIPIHHLEAAKAAILKIKEIYQLK
jgi:hypothetical protein